MIGVIRADDVNLPLFLHVLGAMTLVGSLLVVATALIVSLRREDDGARRALQRLGFSWLFLGVLPSYLLMRIAAQWVESKYDFPEDNEPAWIGIGYAIAEPSALLTLICLILGGIALRRPRRAFSTAVAVLVTLMLVADLVAVWAMTVKPG